MTWLQLVYLLLAGTFASLGQFGITLAYKFGRSPASFTKADIKANPKAEAVINIIPFTLSDLIISSRYFFT